MNDTQQINELNITMHRLFGGNFIAKHKYKFLFWLVNKMTRFLEALHTSQNLHMKLCAFYFLTKTKKCTSIEKALKMCVYHVYGHMLKKNLRQKLFLTFNLFFITELMLDGSSPFIRENYSIFVKLMIPKI